MLEPQQGSEPEQMRGPEVRRGPLVDAPLPRPLGSDRPAPTGRKLCQIVPLDPARGLSHVLLQHIAEEMPELDFCLRPREDVSAIWLCGYEAGHTQAVGELRRRAPSVVLLVTGRAAPMEWEREVREAGADHVSTWPVAYGHLAAILCSERARAARR